MADLVIDDFLKDISAAKPEGESLRLTSDYDAIREASREDPDLPQGIWQHELKTSDWRKVETIAVDILQNKSKDLQVAAWLAEALLLQNNISGLKTGLEIFFAIAEKYWDTAYPQIDPDDPEVRLSPFIWVNDKLSKRIRLAKIADPIIANGRTYQFVDWIAVNRTSGLFQQGDRPQNNRPLETVGGADEPRKLDIDTAILKTDITFYQTLFSDLENTINIAKQCDALIAQKVPDGDVSFYTIISVLEDMQALTERILKSRALPEEIEETPSLEEQVVDTPNEGVIPPEETVSFEKEEPAPIPESIKEIAAAIPNSPLPPQPPLRAAFDSSEGIEAHLQNREDAYERIQEAVTFLTKIEPHSPVPYLIQRAISWRNKSFMDLMGEMNQGGTNISDLARLLGVGGRSNTGSE